MSARRGFGDETWRLAVARDAPALHRAADLQGEKAPHSTMTAAARGRSRAYAVDIARVRFLAGDYRETLDALQLSTRGAEPVEPAVAELTLECVRRDRSLWRHALRVALARGTPWQRLRTAAAVVRARRSPTMPR